MVQIKHKINVSTTFLFSCIYMKHIFYLTHGKIYSHHLINHLTLKKLLGKFCILF